MPIRIAAAALLAALAGCSTTTKKEDYSIRFSEESKKPTATVLDSKLKQLEKLAEEYPKRSDIPFQMAGVWYQKENYKESAKSLQRAIFIDPGETKYHFHLGRVYLNMRELDLAEKEFRRAIELMPVDRYTGPHGALGYVLCQKGKWKEARAEFETCVRIDPTEPNSYYYLGCIHDMLKEEDAAVANLKKYLELGGKGFRPRAVQILASYGVGSPGEETDLTAGPEPLPVPEGREGTAVPGEAPAGGSEGFPEIIPESPAGNPSPGSK